EDGIRDFHVTGVQTCALPISIKESFGFQELSESVIEELLTENDRLGREVLKQKRMVEYYQNQVFLIQSKMVDYEMKELEEFIKRSEERRVGKECRRGGWTLQR